MYYWRRLFPVANFATIYITESVKEFESYTEDESSTNILIIVSEQCPTLEQHDHVLIGGEKYDSRVILFIGASNNAERPGEFNGVRYTCHGVSFSSWWKQEYQNQKKKVMVQYSTGVNPIQDMSNINLPTRFSHVTVYVKLETDRDNKYRLDFHKTLGGQVHVYCHCNTFPVKSMSLSPVTVTR